MLKQFVDLPGVTNSRELGGYEIKDKTIRSGILIRTGDLSKAKPEAVSLLSGKYRVQTVIDFRMTREINASPDPVIPGASNISIPVLEMDDYITKLGDPKAAQGYLSQDLDSRSMFETAYELGLIGPEMYSMFVLGDRGIRAYKAFFREILSHDPDKGALLWHCADGKDRAGLAAVLLLTVLGASREQVFEDYMLTNEYNAPVLEMVRNKYSGMCIPSDKLDALLFTSGGVVERYLSYGYEVIEKKYGGMSGYIREALGVTEAEQNEIRAKYLL